MICIEQYDDMVSLDHHGITQKSKIGVISDVVVKKLDVFNDNRGLLMEVVKEDEDIFMAPKQMNYEETYPGVIKAFHWHAIQWDTWFIPSGMAQVVLYDLRKESRTSKITQVIYMGENNRVAIAIPPKVAHGYRVLGNKNASIVYLVTKKYRRDYSEKYRRDYSDEGRIIYNHCAIGFDWKTKNH